MARKGRSAPVTPVCGTCVHFLGGGDWNLCCDKKYDLCYRRTKACGLYEYDPDKLGMLQERDRMLADYVRRMRDGVAEADEMGKRGARGD